MALKAPSKMSADELLAELAEQVNAGVEFDTEFNEQTPVEDLRELVKVGRKALKEGGSEEGEESEGESGDETSEESTASEGSEESGPEESEEEVETEGGANIEIKSAAKVVVVCNPMEYTREYSELSHGPNWKILAEQYCENLRNRHLVQSATLVAQK